MPAPYSDDLRQKALNAVKRGERKTDVSRMLKISRNSAVILQNTVDISYTVRALSEEGYKVDRALLATLSPYLTRHLKRYGDYVVDMENIPQPLEGAIALPIEIAES